MSNSQLHIILASTSPQRKKLLTEAGFEFKIVPPDLDESVFSTESISPCEYAKQLALAKAKSIADEYPGFLIIGADTIVDFKGQIIGKAADAEEAEQITKKLFSAPHKVITGLAIINTINSTEAIESDTTIVYPKKLSATQITEHIKSNSWQGKAGAYAIQENGDEFIERIQGSMTNVMGLPMELLQQMLKKIS